MAAASGKKKKVKGKTLNLNEFLGSNDGGGAETTVTVKSSWADEMENNDFEELDDTAYKVSLPTAPRAARGPNVDMSKVPTEAPFTAFMGNLPFDVEESEIERFFHGLRIQNVRFPPGKSKGFGYCDFDDRQSLVDALSLNDEQIRNRKVRIDLADHQNNERNERREGRDGWKDNRREDDEDRTLGDWRRRAPDEGKGPDDRDSGRDRYNDRGGDRDRDRGGFGNRDRDSDRDRGGFGGDRDRGFGGDRDRRDGGGFGDRDRRDGGGFGDRDRDRGGFNRGYGGDRDRDRGFGGDRFGDRDRGGFGGDRDRDRGGFGNRDRDRGFGGDRDRRDGGGFGDRDRRDGGGFGDRDRRDGGGFGDRDRRDGGGFGDRDRDRDGGRRAFGSGFRGGDRDGGPGDRDGYDRPPPRDRGYRDGSFERNRDGPPPERDTPRERPRLNLQPRSKPVEPAAAPPPAPESGRAASIFGSAKPVDTAAREREIEERLNRQRDIEKERHEQEREKRLSDEYDRRRDDHDYHDDRSPQQYDKLSSSTSDRGARTRSDSGSEVNGPSERRRERKSSSGSGRNIRTVAPPPTSGSARIRRDSTLSGDEDVFEDGSGGKTSKPTTPKDKEAPSKLVPAPPPKENIWQKRKVEQQQHQPPPQPKQPTSPPASKDSSMDATPSPPRPKPAEEEPPARQQPAESSPPQPKPQEPSRPKENPWNRGSRPADKPAPKTSTVSIADLPKENINPAPAPKENAWGKKPEITPHKNSVVVSVNDPPKVDNVWARRKAEQDQKDADRKEPDGSFSGSHWGKSRGGSADRGAPRPGGRGARSGPNERGFGRGRGAQHASKPAERKEKPERPLPKSIEEMPKLQQHSDKDWSSANVFSNLANDDEEVQSDHSQ